MASRLELWPQEVFTLVGEMVVSLEEGAAVPYDVEVKDLPPQFALTVRKRASMGTISEALGQAFAAIMECAAGRAQHAGPFFALYPAEVTAEFEVIVCVPVAAEASGAGDVTAEKIAGGTVASTTHMGPYSGLGSAYGALQAWMVANDKKPSGPCREVYLNEPGSVPDAELITEVDWPFV